MTIKTASIREIKKLPKSVYKIIAMRYFPFWIKNIKSQYDEWIPDLAPSKELLNDFMNELKRLKDTDMSNEKKVKLAWNISKYESRFRREMTHSSDAMRELRRIAGLAKTKEVILICHEPKDDYCHRRIVKELIELAIDRGWSK